LKIQKKNKKLEIYALKETEIIVSGVVFEV